MWVEQEIERGWNSITTLYTINGQLLSSHGPALEQSTHCYKKQI